MRTLVDTLVRMSKYVLQNTLDDFKKIKEKLRTLKKFKKNNKIQNA